MRRARAPRAIPASTGWSIHAIRYYDDFVKPQKTFRAPSEKERAALADLADALDAMAGERDGAKVQFEVYEIGKRHDFEPLRDWFKAIYEVVIGQSAGPALRLLRRPVRLRRDRRADPPGAGRRIHGRNMRIAAAAALLCALIALPARADAPTPLQLYQAGQYDAAIQAGVAEKSATGYAAAARAALAQERMRPAPCLDCLKQAETYARQAIAADPTLADGRVFLAAALGFEARIIGIVAAKFQGYAGEAKDSLDVAYAHHPDDARTLAALGGWNFAVVNGGGRVLASLIYGATVKQGLAFYARAMAAAPGDIVIRFEYALSLSDTDRTAYGKDIEAALQSATAMMPRTAYERFMQSRARTLLDAFRQGDWPQYTALVRKDEGYPD